MKASGYEIFKEVVSGRWRSNRRCVPMLAASTELQLFSLGDGINALEGSPLVSIFHLLFGQF